jgi:hypothetical protein
MGEAHALPYRVCRDGYVVATEWRAAAKREVSSVGGFWFLDPKYGLPTVLEQTNDQVSFLCKIGCKNIEPTIFCSNRSRALYTLYLALIRCYFNILYFYSNHSTSLTSIDILTIMPKESYLSDTLDTPPKQCDRFVTESIRSIAAMMESPNADEEPATKHPRYLKFPPEQLSQLITACSSPMTQLPTSSSPSPTFATPLPAITPAYDTNAKIPEQKCSSFITRNSLM